MQSMIKINQEKILYEYTNMLISRKCSYNSIYKLQSNRNIYVVLCWLG